MWFFGGGDRAWFRYPKVVEKTQSAGRSDGWLRRKRKFDEMAADLSKVLAGKANVILCPLCLKEFEESDVEKNLTEEHVIPSSAAGRITTLTCRTCNSECGSEIDSHFARVFRIEEARQSGGQVDARIKIRDSVGSPRLALLRTGYIVASSRRRNMPGKCCWSGLCSTQRASGT